MPRSLPAAEDRRRLEPLGELNERRGPSRRGVGLAELGDVDGLDADARSGRVRGGQERLDRVAQRAGEREGLQGELAGSARLLLDEQQRRHARPSPAISSTTAAAASAPWPSTRACFP